MRSRDGTIRDLVEHWTDAEHRGDVTVLRFLLADTFMGVVADGNVLDKPAWLERYQSGDLVNHAFRWRTIDVHARGLATTVLGELDQVTSYRGDDISGSLTVTLVVSSRRRRRRLLEFHARLANPLHSAHGA